MADIVIDIDDIVSEFGDHYIDNGQGQKDLRVAILDRSETDMALVLRPTNDTLVQSGNVDMDPVLQGFQTTFTPYGGITVTPHDIILRQLKIDVEYFPDKLVKSWLGWLASNDVDRSKWPFVKWLIQIYLIPKQKEDWELNAIFSGVYSAPTDGVPHPVGDSVDGIKTLINNAIDNSLLSPIVVGDPPTDPADFVQYIEGFVDQIPEKYMSYLGTLNMSKTLEKRFRRGMRQLYNLNYNQVGDLLQVIDTNLVVKGFRSHEGSGKIWTTPVGNAGLYQKAPANQNTFKVEVAKRKLAIYTDYWKAPAFERYDWIFTNDSDLSEEE